jgi:hypothetical protein
MTHVPESLLILVAFDKDDEIRAFSILSNPGPAYPYVQLQQIWSHPENDWDWVDKFFARAVLWACSLDKEYIRAETQRDTEALFRRHGFETLSHNVKFDLIKTGFHDLLINRPEELVQWANLTQKPNQSLESRHSKAWLRT